MLNYHNRDDVTVHNDEMKLDTLQVIQKQVLQLPTCIFF